MSVVAIDGPSGVGKSSTAKETARRLGYSYLDTGAMYRAMAWLCLNRGVTDPVDVLEQVRGVDLEISTDPDEFFVSVDGIDVSEEIREPRCRRTCRPCLPSSMPAKSSSTCSGPSSPRHRRESSSRDVTSRPSWPRTLRFASS